MEKYSDISDVDHNSDDNNMDNEVLKLFDSENEIEASFSGFENEKVKTPPKKGSKKSSTVSHQSTELGPGKGPRKNLKKKAPMKKRTTKSKSASLKNQNLIIITMLTTS